MSISKQSQLLGDILERALNEIFIFDAETLKFTQVNKGARENIGYSMDELAELTPADIKPGYSQAEFEQFIAPLLNGEIQRLEFETIHQRKDGSSYPVEIDLQIDRNSDSIVFVAITSDITQRRLTEKTLEEERSILRNIIDSTPDLIFLKDTEGTYLRCNKAFESFFGSPESNITGKTDFDFVDAETAQFFRDKDSSMMAKGISQINEETVIYPDGHEVLLETLKTPFKNASGQVLGLLGISRDITQQRKSEQDLHIAGKVFESSNEGIIVTDADNNIIKVNPAFSAITGYSAEEIIGKNPRILSSGLQSVEFYQQLWEALHIEGSWTGEIWNRRKNGETFPQWLSISTVKDSEGEIQQYIAMMSDITEAKESQKRIAFLAHHDVLTQLPNRALLSDRIHQALLTAERNSQKVALLFLDLDRFKYINDRLGHSIGDELLIEVTQRLTGHVREEDTVSRTGGDEFTVLLINTDEKGAAHVAQNLIDSISQSFKIEGNELYITLSIGISLYPDNGHDEQILNQKADTAMYRAKHGGRNQYQFFTEEMHTEMVHKIELENHLRFALDRNELELVYQAQVDINTHKIIGCEALLRWNHPKKGYISPVEFIPIAEETGLINSIGDWVLHSTTEQLQQWIMAGYPHFIMAVNLSSLQFSNIDLVTNIQTILKQRNIPENNLEIEITESIAMKDIDLTTTQLHALSDAGILISLDDFGTGYSSLSYLKKFPIDKLKIDQTFIFDMLDDEDDGAIVDAVITLAQSLGLETIAEGVETKEQMEALRMKGCNQIQGYYFSKPIPAEQFSQLLDNHKVD